MPLRIRSPALRRPRPVPGHARAGAGTAWASAEPRPCSGTRAPERRRHGLRPDCGPLPGHARAGAGRGTVRRGAGGCGQSICRPGHDAARYGPDPMVHRVARRQGRPACPLPLSFILPGTGSRPSPARPFWKPPCGQGGRPRSDAPTGAAENAGRASSPGRSSRSGFTTTPSRRPRSGPDTRCSARSLPAATSSWNPPRRRASTTSRRSACAPG